MKKKKKKYSFKRRNKRKTTIKVILINGRQFRLLRYANMWVFPEISTYIYGLGSPIAMSLLIYQSECFNEYIPVTVNLPDCKHNAGCQFIDIYNNEPFLIKWLINNKFGELTGRNGRSGFCSYPEFNFYAGETFRYYKAINDKLNEKYEIEIEEE